jgi:hypothetical protein
VSLPNSGRLDHDSVTVTCGVGNGTVKEESRLAVSAVQNCLKVFIML